MWALAGRLRATPPKVEIKMAAWKMSFITIGLSLWCLAQILVPLRHFLYPSNVHWSEEGHRFAWHMMLRDKRGDVRFLITESTGKYLQITSKDVLEREILTSRQLEKMTTRPYMIHQFTHYLAQRFEKVNFPDVNVQVLSETSLNGRNSQHLLDPSVNFAAEPILFGMQLGLCL